MRRTSPRHRIASAFLIAAMLGPAPGWAADDADADAEEPPAVSAAPLEERWYDTALHNANTAIDLLLIRPAAALTLGVGAVLLVPVAVMTAPNGWESVQDAYQRFVGEPYDYLTARELGEL